MQDLLGTLEYVSWRRRVPAGDAAQAKARGLDDASARQVEVGFFGLFDKFQRHGNARRDVSDQRRQ